MDKSAGSWLLKASWGPRKEDSETSAGHLLAYLKSLSEIDATMTNWCRTAKRKAMAHEQVKLEIQALASLLAAGINRSDAGDQLTQLGWGVSIWNCDAVNGISLIVRCGGFSQYVRNEVQLYIQQKSEALDRLLRGDAAVRLLAATAEIWEPDWASLAPAESSATPSRDGFIPGWINYFKDVSTHQLQALGEVRSVRPEGHLLIVSPDPTKEIGASLGASIASLL